MNAPKLLLSLLLVAGCGGGPAKPPTRPEPKPQHGEIACSAELALACAEDSHDGCGDGQTLFHVCVANGETTGPSCTEEVAKVCGDGQVDACLATPALAANHVCVYPAAEPVSPSASCPEGEGWVTPGCGGEATSAFDAGCYATCSDGQACGAGFTCTDVTIDPCAGEACDACGAGGQICLPAT